MEIAYYRKMRNIDRLSMMYKTRRYNLLEHQYMVTVLFRHFASKEDIPYGINELDLILHHDAVESVTSDLSWEVKNFNKIVKESWEIIEQQLCSKHFQLNKYSDENLVGGLNDIQYKLFKACDVLDLLIFVKEEISYGNKSLDIVNVLNNCFMLLEKYADGFPKLSAFVEDLKQKEVI